jgi:L-rhamnose mutarotase
MIRKAFTMRLKHPSTLAPYKEAHDNVWPELVAEIEKCGIASITIFERAPDLFLFSEIQDPDAWDKLWNGEIHLRWAKVMEQYMFIKPDGTVDAGELREIFRLETKAGEKGK